MAAVMLNAQVLDVAIQFLYKNISPRQLTTKDHLCIYNLLYDSSLIHALVVESFFGHNLG